MIKGNMNLNTIRFGEGTSFLVTGGAGFIGSNLCEALLDRGCRVKCLDNFSFGKRKNLEKFANDPNFILIEGDIRNPETCLDACYDVEYVLHQAAMGSVPRSIELPQLYEDVNTRGTLNMLEAARQAGVEKFVYASSSSVYGDETTLPKREDLVGKVLSPYALTKKTCEEYGRLYYELFGLSTIGLRYFNVFGRRQDPDGPYAAVIPKFVKALSCGERPVIYGDGAQSRDFTYVDNVVEANLKACFAPDSASGEVFNIAFGGRTTLIDMYHMLCEYLGNDMEPIFDPPRRGDILHSNADISKAREILGYDPQWDFNRGLKASIEWYRETLA
jgi:UDP-N-acetylglucosamine 4-epimerase